MELFEQKYQANMEADEAILLSLEGLQQSMEDPQNLTMVEICTIQKDKGFTRLTADQIQGYVKQLAPKDKTPKS